MNKGKKMAKTKINQPNIVKDMVQRSENKQQGPDIYANHVQLSVSQYDVVLDFYRLSPTYKNLEKIEAALVQRIVLPLSAIKGLSGALNETIEVFERDTKIVLPDYHKNSDEIKDGITKETPDA